MRLLSLFVFLPLLAGADQDPEGRLPFIEASISYHRGFYADCVTGYQQTIALHHEVTFSKMMIARCYGLLGQLEQAMDALDEAAEFEFAGVQILRTDPEFEAERQHPRFPAILAKVQANNAAPCAPRAIRHQLDFWLGAWDVTDSAGRSVGTDRIQAAEGGCLLRESFTGAAGGSGESVSFYEKFTGYWRQVWMDPSGLSQDLSGELTPDGMLFRQVTYNGGLKTIVIVTYSALPDGAVRQLSRRSIDDGATFTTSSDFVYRRQAQ